jgi:hypothetical protein
MYPKVPKIVPRVVFPGMFSEHWTFSKSLLFWEGDIFGPRFVTLKSKIFHIYFNTIFSSPLGHFNFLRHSKKRSFVNVGKNVLKY